MAATMRVTARRTTSHHPLHARLAAWLLPYSRRAQTVYFERVRAALPVTNPDRHDLENPATEAAFARLAITHPDRVTPADGGQPARLADHEQQLLALCDAWFRDSHGPERSWSPQMITAYTKLLDSVHAYCSGGAS